MIAYAEAMQLAETDIRDLYPDLTDAELTEAKANLDRYLELVLRISARIAIESGEHVDQS